ncbi:alpha/beta fold hydrolase [Kordiimonas pumila]|uniref:Alpha/beta fold hydrolase n=1 Tax=Kordiimonas pumila TaxID=2161677 RepID=A0ABV7D956_9PROT|nr:alpha/beta hydrolase [Kordiimonas pumila]
MIDFDQPEMVATNGVTLPVFRGGPAFDATDKPAVIFLHGFPEIAYSWRQQMEALAREGYPVLAPNQRGYAGASAPEGKENYSLACLTGDIAGLLDHYGLEKAVFVGHDWGAIILWSLPFYIGERVLGCAGLNVPLMRHYPSDPISLFREKLGEAMYIVRFQEEGPCEALFEQDIEKTLKFFFRKPKASAAHKQEPSFNASNLDLISLFEAGEEAWGGELLLPESDLQRYIAAFTESGFTGPIHWYRNMAENWRAEQAFLVDGVLPKVQKPCLMITADLDRACPARLADGMEALCSPFERVDLKGCGHWSQQEKATEVNTALLDWLLRHFKV